MRVFAFQNVRIGCALRIAACPPPSKYLENVVRAASPDTFTLYLRVDNTVCMYERLRDELKQIITLPAFPGSPLEITMETARPAIVVKDSKMKEMWMSRADGDTWTAWQPLVRTHTEKLNIRSMCMSTSNMLLAFDSESNSVKQYELA